MKRGCPLRPRASPSKSKSFPLLSHSEASIALFILKKHQRGRGSSSVSAPRL